MKFYLSAAVSDNELAKKIDEYLSKNGVILFSHLQNSDTPATTFEKLEGLIVLTNAQNTESGYLCALAIAQRKPILYLLPLGNMIPDEIKLLQSNPQVSKLLMVKFFQENNIESRLAEFIDLLENGRGDWELPTIKFTWRISPRIERYLRWKTVNTKKTKADWLREYLLKEIIDKDEEYKGFLRNI